jgi:hypothetical protein
MGLFDALNHLLNFVLPALAMALIVPALARLAFWRALRAKPLWPQIRRAGAINVLVLVMGLFLTGRDGAMLTYAALVLSSAFTVWWIGLR